MNWFLPWMKPLHYYKRRYLKALIKLPLFCMLSKLMTSSNSHFCLFAAVKREFLSSNAIQSLSYIFLTTVTLNVEIGKTKSEISKCESAIKGFYLLGTKELKKELIFNVEKFFIKIIFKQTDYKIWGRRIRHERTLENFKVNCHGFLGHIWQCGTKHFLEG